MVCEKCKKIERRPIRMKTQVFLWVYQEVENGAPTLYSTFITEDQAESIFGGKWAYQKLNHQNIRKGFNL